MQKTVEEELAIQKRWEKRCLFNGLKKHLPEGYCTTNVDIVAKQVKVKNSAEPLKLWWTSWCVDNNGNKYLALFDGEKLKLIPEEKKADYYIKTVK